MFFSDLYSGGFRFETLSVCRLSLLMILVIFLEFLLKILGQPQELVAYCFLRRLFQPISYKYTGLSPVLFNIYINKIIQEFKLVIKKDIPLNNRKILNTILYADDQILMATSEDGLQIMAYHLNLIAGKYKMTISGTETKSMTMCGNYIQGVKIVINNNIIEEVTDFQ